MIVTKFEPKVSWANFYWMDQKKLHPETYNPQQNIDEEPPEGALVRLDTLREVFTERFCWSQIAINGNPMMTKDNYYEWCEMVAADEVDTNATVPEEVITHSKFDSIIKPVLKICAVCCKGLEEEFINIDDVDEDLYLTTPLQNCGHCHQAYYCSRECQQIAYPSHKNACKKSSEKKVACIKMNNPHTMVSHH